MQSKSHLGLSPLDNQINLIAGRIQPMGELQGHIAYTERRNEPWPGRHPLPEKEHLGRRGTSSLGSSGVNGAGNQFIKPPKPGAFIQDNCPDSEKTLPPPDPCRPPEKQSTCTPAGRLWTLMGRPSLLLRVSRLRNNATPLQGTSARWYREILALNASFRVSGFSRKRFHRFRSPLRDRTKQRVPITEQATRLNNTNRWRH
ncbi:hypothetical protein NPIL_243951 [Nephila pilipes]|uniref:Uncharacterized protein n=1 Tax=Nephila pilipes TaxID=299642 RepID=A0A8X6JRZ0_NEPPI|nr:hypothetical protein NPIL_243951 [Nephila pilipes]